MAREKTTQHTIALLATGDEICHGDIINSNSQEIAQRLVRHGMEVRLHMTAPDTEREIETALRFLLNSHQAVIMTGGLGPTSDDLTRFALSKVLNQPLEFNETIWQDICQRLKRFGYDVPPESNRQQALFPNHATIIPNPNGTAAGCYIEYDGKWIFMLPGPPSECLPMIDHVVIPTLLKAHFQHIAFYRHWLLFGVSEGKIAEELDLLADPYDCITGYRLVYPYIEFKLYSNHKEAFDTLVQLVENTIQPYLISDGQQTATQLFRQRIKDEAKTFQIIDHATGGTLQATLTTPETRPFLHFSETHTADITVHLDGLQEYWQGRKDTTQTEITLQIKSKQRENSIETTIPFRGKRVLSYTVEWVAARIMEFINATN